jgi:hypothetical protein
MAHIYDIDDCSSRGCGTGRKCSEKRGVKVYRAYSDAHFCKLSPTCHFSAD